MVVENNKKEVTEANSNEQKIVEVEIDQRPKKKSKNVN